MTAHRVLAHMATYLSSHFRQQRIGLVSLGDRKWARRRQGAGTPVPDQVMKTPIELDRSHVLSGRSPVLLGDERKQARIRAAEWQLCRLVFRQAFLHNGSMFW
jgi:hypothetical protein